MKYDDLRKRMDDDLLLYYLDEFTLRDSKGKKMEKVKSITLNDPRTYADTVIHTLGTATRNLDVFDIDPSKHRQLEHVYKQSFDHNDDKLALVGIEPFRFGMEWFICLRGWIAASCLTYRDGKKWSPNYVSLDPRWMEWDYDTKGMVRVKDEFRMTAEQAQEEFGYDSPKGKDVSIERIWTRDDWSVGIKGNDEHKKSIPHNLGRCPVTVIPAPTQPLLISSGALLGNLRYQGESIYAADRKIYYYLNEVASVWATLNMMQFLAPMIYVSSKGSNEIEISPYCIGAIVQIDLEEKLLEMPTKEMTISAQALFQQLLGNAQRGSLSRVHYGEVSHDLSYLAIAQLGDAQKQVFEPRFKAISRMYKWITQTQKDQIVKGGYRTDIEGDYLEFDEKLFEERFSVLVNFKARSAEQKIADMEVGARARALGLSKKTTFKEIMGMEDADGEISLAETERAHEIIPELELFDMWIGLGTEEIDEKEVNETRAEIIKSYLDKVRADRTASQLPSSNMPSQPALDFGVSNSTPRTDTRQTARNRRNQIEGSKNPLEG